FVHPTHFITHSFFFQRHAHHHDLHSFPTRRSSDLARSADPTRVQQGEPGGRAHPHPRPDVADAAAAASRGSRGHPARPEDLGTLDRKSTRLNSSHVSISYAVFCLKKKIKLYSTSNT